MTGVQTCALPIFHFVSLLQHPSPAKRTFHAFKFEEQTRNEKTFSVKSKNIKQEFSISTSINNQENNTRFQIEEKKTQCNCETQSAFPALIIEISETFRLSITPHSKVNTTSENIQQHEILKLKKRVLNFNINQHSAAKRTTHAFK